MPISQELKNILTQNPDSFTANQLGSNPESWSEAMSFAVEQNNLTIVDRLISISPNDVNHLSSMINNDDHETFFCCVSNGYSEIFDRLIQVYQQLAAISLDVSRSMADRIAAQDFFLLDLNGPLQELLDMPNPLEEFLHEFEEDICSPMYIAAGGSSQGSINIANHIFELTSQKYKDQNARACIQIP